jgi:hypothetical protein
MTHVDEMRGVGISLNLALSGGQLFGRQEDITVSSM